MRRHIVVTENKNNSEENIKLINFPLTRGKGGGSELAPSGPVTGIEFLESEHLNFCVLKTFKKKLWSEIGN